VVLCSGADMETLFPETIANHELTKCKLQMMRFVHDDPEYRVNAAVCGGLSLIHYASFQVAKSLADLKKRYEAEMPEYLANGIHVMVSQNDAGELIVGDTHEYGLTFDPFDRTELNVLVANYLKQFMHTERWRLIQTWNGIYPITTNGASEVFLNPLKDVYIINGVGGAGMTMSFGLAEELVGGM
jgi:FAD dependent oxidoreductase TIGR03364